MQLRNHHPGIRVAGHWGLFGGDVAPGEDEEAALRRELAEEVELEPARLRRFTELTYIEPVPPRKLCRKALFEAAVNSRGIAALRLREGAAMRLMALDELLRELLVVPWDAFVMLHVRARLVFPDAAGG